MPSRQQIKARIGSVKNTKQITKAMELVAASRMRKAQELVARTRLFTSLATELLTRLRQLVNVSEYVLFRDRPVKKRLLIVVTSDRGLAGAYNSNILRRYITELNTDRAANIKTASLVIGRQAAHFSAKIQDVEVIGVYQNFPDEPTSNEILPITSSVISLFERGEIDAVNIIYTRYYSSIRQEVEVKHLLPAGFEDVPVPAEVQVAEFEPSPEVVLEAAARRLIEVQLMEALLNAAAAEHSMRMLAMKSATDNARDLADDLTLAYNNARQAAITQELAEITGGAEAMS